MTGFSAGVGGRVEVESDSIRVDAELIAEGLGMAPSDVVDGLRAGRVTSRCERGSEEDEGRYRLTFFGEGNRFQIVIDERGDVLRRFKLAGRARERLRSGTAPRGESVSPQQGPK